MGREYGSRADILGGKPVLEGTRISVDHVLGLLENGMTVDEIPEADPILAREDVLAAVSYARRSLADDLVVDVATG